MKDTKTKILISRICSEYIKKHLSILFIALFCMVIVSATTAINAWMMQPVLDDIFINKDKRLMMIIPIAVIIIAAIIPFTIIISDWNLCTFRKSKFFSLNLSSVTA